MLLWSYHKQKDAAGVKLVSSESFETRDRRRDVYHELMESVHPLLSPQPLTPTGQSISHTGRELGDEGGGGVQHQWV